MGREHGAVVSLDREKGTKSMTCICVSPNIVKAIDDDLDWFPTTRGVGHGAVKKEGTEEVKGGYQTKKERGKCTAQPCIKPC